jgi:ATP-dependent Zn protease
MGGRVAEEISRFSALYDYYRIGTEVGLVLVYGADGVTSGASSDLQRATQVASAMVKVCNL